MKREFQIISEQKKLMPNDYPSFTFSLLHDSFKFKNDLIFICHNFLMKTQKNMCFYGKRSV